MNKDTKGNHLEPSGVSLSQDGQSVKVGDLIKHAPSGDLGFIINVDLWGYTMVKWLDGFGAIEDVDMYHGELEVVSEAG